MEKKTNQMMTEEEKIREEQRAYHQEYRETNRKRIREKQKEWREANPEKVAEINRRYWLRKAEKNQAN